MTQEELSEQKNKLGPEVELPRAIERAIDGLERADSCGQAVVLASPGQWPALASALKSAGFESLVDLCGVDYLGDENRFEVVVNLLSYALNLRLRVRIRLAGTVCPSAYGVWPGADWFERETYDMFGIEFTGHPELTRILMPDDWEGHPLRKDFATGAIPVQFSENPKPQ